MPDFSILLDDTSPVNLMSWHEPDSSHVRDISPEFFFQFLEVCRKTGIRGKSSLIPVPGKVITPNSFPETFLESVKNLHKLGWEFSLEGLTHTETPNGVREDDFFDLSSDTQIYDYLVKCYELCVSTFGVPITGVTSPWASGANNLRNYEAAISRLRRDHISSETFIWYFLHVSYNKRDHLKIKNSATEPTVYHIPANVSDLWWNSQNQSNSHANDLAIERIRWLLGKRLDYVTILIHWQSLFSEGTFHGLNQFHEFISRVNAEIPEVRWVTPSQRISEKYPSP